MSPPHPSRSCSRCGRSIPPDAPGGDCPVCLLRAGFDSHVDDDAPADPLDVAAVAARFPKLEILGRVGRGGMGVVYQARQRALDRIVALKILHPDLAKRDGFAERFEREARSLALLDHPHIVRMYEAGNEGGLYYLMMEFVDGSDLRSVMNQGVPPQSALRLVQEISDALEYAHGKGVVHRDIKPENILVDRAFRAKIVDFGLAKLLAESELGPNLTQSRVVMGTPHYMAPEQMKGLSDVDHRADIFSLGVVFYEMLTGALPVGHFPPPSKKVAIDVRLDEVVLRALENERELRFQRAGEVGTSVRSIEGASGRASRPPERVQPPFSRSAILSVIVLATAILAMPIASLAITLLPQEHRTHAHTALRVLWYAAGVWTLVLAIQARKETARNPRLAGRRVANAMAIASTLFFLASFGIMLWSQQRAKGLDDLKRSLEDSMRIDPLYVPSVPDIAGVEERIRTMNLVREHLESDLLSLSTKEPGDVDPYLDLYEPAAKARIARLEPTERMARARRGELGLPAAVAAGAIEEAAWRDALERTLRLESDTRGYCVIEFGGGPRECRFLRVDDRWLWNFEVNGDTSTNDSVDR